MQGEWSRRGAAVVVGGVEELGMVERGSRVGSGCVDPSLSTSVWVILPMDGVL